MSFAISVFFLAWLAVGDPANSLPAFQAAVASAKPGDRITLAPGTYEGTLWFENLRGEKDLPITIGGSDPANPPVIRAIAPGSDGKAARLLAECLHLSGPAHVVVENLILERATGNGVNVDDGRDFSRLAPGVVLRHVTVRDIGPEGNTDGIKLSGLGGFLVENCTVERWGRGGSGIDIVGCHDGVIRDCAIRHSAPTGLQTTPGASGIQAKGGSKDIVIRSCRFEHAGQRAVNIGGSTGLQYFRPPLPQPRGEACFEASNIVVEECTIVGSEAAIAFVGVDGADVRFNTIYHPRRWAIRILQETREAGFVPCRRGSFTSNVVVFGDTQTTPHQAAVNTGDKTEPTNFVFARNVWYFEKSPSAHPVLPAAEVEGVYAQDPQLRDPERGDFTPRRFKRR